MCLCNAKRGQKRIKDPMVTRVTAGPKSSYGWWERNMGSLEEELVSNC